MSGRQQAEGSPAPAPEADWVAPQKAFFRAVLAAGVKDAEIARRSGVGHRKEISLMRHGHRQINRAVLTAIRSIQADVAALDPPPCKD